MINFLNGGRFEGTFEKGDKCGPGKLTLPNGDTVVASYTNDMLNGSGVFTKGGKAIDCVWYDDVKIQLKPDRDDGDRMGCGMFLQMLVWILGVIMVIMRMGVSEEDEDGW